MYRRFRAVYYIYGGVWMTPLEKSIEHWKENVAAMRPSQVKVAGRYCALCAEHWSETNPGDNECSGCPVENFTGYSGCDESPFWQASFAADLWRSNPNTPECATDFALAAQAELDFLISLLPE